MSVSGWSLSQDSTRDLYDVTAIEDAVLGRIDGEHVVIRTQNAKLRVTALTLTGTQTAAFTVTSGSDDRLLLTVDDEEDIAVTLPSGNRNASQIAAAINAEFDETVADVSSNRIRFTARRVIDIKTVANDAYTLLGLTVGETEGGGYITNSTIRVKGDQGGTGNSNTGAFLNVSNRANKRTVEVVGSTVTVGGTIRKDAYVTRCEDSTIVMESATARNVFFYSMVDARIVNVRLVRCSTWEVYRRPRVASGVTFVDCASGPLNWEAGRLDFLALDLQDMATNAPHLWLGGGNSGNNTSAVWNPGAGFDEEKIYLQHANSAALIGYTWFPEFRDETGPVDGATVIYRDDRVISNAFVVRGTYATDSDGRLVGTHDSQQDAIEASASRPVLWMRTQLVDQDASGSFPNPAAVNPGGQSSARRYNLVAVQPRVEVRSYTHLQPVGYGMSDNFAISSPIGALDAAGEGENPATVFLTLDAAVTESNRTTVDAYTTLPTAARAYDRLKSLWTFQGDRGTNLTGPYCTRTGDTLDFGSRNVALRASGVVAEAANPGNVTFTGSIVTTGTVTVGAGVTVAGSITDSTGVLVTVAGLPANHQAVANAWLASQGANDPSNDITGTVADSAATTIQLKLAANTEYFVGADAISYRRSAPIRLDTTNTTSVTVGLARIQDAAGLDLIPDAADLTSDEQDQLAQITWNDTDHTIRVGAMIGTDGTPGVAASRMFGSGNSAFTVTANIPGTGGNSLRAHVAGGPSGAVSVQLLLSGTLLDIVRGSDQDASAIVAAINASASVSAVFTAALASGSDGSGVPSTQSTVFLTGGVDAVPGTDPIESISFRAMARAIEVGQSSAVAQGYPHTIHIDSGQFTIGADSDHTFRRATGIANTLVPDLTAFSIQKEGTDAERDYIDYDHGALAVNTQAPLFATVTVPSGLTVDVAQSTWDTRMAAVPAATREDYQADVSTLPTAADILAELRTGDWDTTTPGTQTLPALIAGGGGGAVPTVAQIVDGIKAADFPDVSGQDDRLGSLLQYIKTIVDVISLDTSDIVNIQTAVNALPQTQRSEPPTTAQILAALRTGDWDTTNTGTQTLATLIANAGGGGGGSGPTVAQIVAGLVAADWDPARSGTQTLADLLAEIQPARTAARATMSFGTGNSEFEVTARTAGTAGNMVTVALNYTGSGNTTAAASGNAVTVTVGAANTATNIVAAITANSAANALVSAFLPSGSDGSGTFTASITATNLTGGQAATTSLLHDAEATINDTTHGLEEFYNLYVIDDILTAIVDAKALINNLPQTAAEIATATLAASVESGIDVQRSLRLALAVLAGRTTVDDNNDQVTYKRLDTARTNALRITLDDPDGTRSNSEVL